MRVTKLIIVAGIPLLLGAVALAYIGAMHETASRLRCSDHLRGLGLSLHNFSDAQGRLPFGTLHSRGLPPERRLSWLVELWPYIQAGPELLLDTSQAWDAEPNCPLRWTGRKALGSGEAPDELLAEVAVFRCPANPGRSDFPWPTPTDYVGIAGLGPQAAQLPLSDWRAGFFGYDRLLRFQDIKDGLSTTMAVAEVTDGRPWTEGGSATVRGLVRGDQPYLGRAGQFSSYHRRGFVPFSRPVVANVLFADGSVRGLSDSVSPQILEALATVAGGEKVAALPDGEVW